MEVSPKKFCRLFTMPDGNQVLFLLLPEFPYQKHVYLAMYVSRGYTSSFQMTYLTFENWPDKKKFFDLLSPSEVQDWYIEFKRTGSFVPGDFLPAEDVFPFLKDEEE